MLWVFFFSIFIFNYLAETGLYGAIWDIVPCSGIESRGPALGVWSLSRRTTREDLGLL